MHVRLLAWVQCARITASIASGGLDEVLYSLVLAACRKPQSNIGTSCNATCGAACILIQLES